MRVDAPALMRAGAMLLLLSCSRVIDLGSSGVCLAPPASCLDSPDSCTLALPTTSEPFDPASRVTSRGPSYWGPTIAVGASATFAAWEVPSPFLVLNRELRSTVVRARSVEQTSNPRCSDRPLTGGAAAWGEGGFLLVGFVQSTWELSALRLTEAGRPLDAACLRLGPGPAKKSPPAIAAVPGGFLVLWSEADGRLLGARIDSQGAIVPLPGPLSLTATLDAPVLSSNGTSLLAVWNEADSMRTQLFATPLDLQGTALAPAARLAVTTGLSQPAVASDGVNFMVAWGDFREGNGSRIYAARVTPAGVVLDPGGRKISSQPSAGVMTVQANVALVFDGRDYRVLWYTWPWLEHFTGSLTGTRVRTDGTPVTPDSVLMTNVEQSRLALTREQGKTEVYFGDLWGVWRVSLVDGEERFDEASRLALNHSPNSPKYPRLSSATSGLLAVWSEERYSDLNQVRSSFGLFGRRLQDASTALDAEPFAVTSDAAPFSFDVATDGVDHLVVWHQQTSTAVTILTALVPGDATRPPTAPVTIATVPSSVFETASCFDGEGWQVAFISEAALFTQRLSRDGAAREPPRRVAESVSALRLAKRGRCVGAVIIASALSRLELHAAAEPSLAPIDAVLPAGSRLEVDGTIERLFVAWVERAGEVQRLAWRAVDQAGHVLAHEEPVPLAGNIQGYVVTATPDAFLVLLTDVSPSAVTTYQWVTRLFRFTAHGRRFGAPADLREGLTWVTASADPRGSVTVATTAFDAASLVERSAIFSLAWQAIGQPCSTDSQCASGRCGAR